MQNANALLFHTKFNGVALFSSQLDLVSCLLDDPESKYYVPKTDSKYPMHLNRLKAYISQLLSANVNRTITDDFRDTLSILVAKKLKGNEQNAGKVTAQIIHALKMKNRSNRAEHTSGHISEQIYATLMSASYISIVTARPLEISDNLQSKSFSFQVFFIGDIVKSFTQPGHNFKSYRFNFPMRQYGEIFWSELKKIISGFLLQFPDRELLANGLFLNYYFTPEKLEPLRREGELSPSSIDKLTSEILFYLNRRNRYLLIFVVQLPIFSMPTIAVDPDDSENAHLYAVFDTKDRAMIHKYSKEDYFLWRLFVWDKLKTDTRGQIDELKFEEGKKHV